MLILQIVTWTSVEVLFQRYLLKLLDLLYRKSVLGKLQLFPVRLLSQEVEISNASTYFILP